MKRYEIIYADFPWPYTSFGTARLPYRQMSEWQIAHFDWGRFMAKRCVLFSWVTGPKLTLATRCGEIWSRDWGLCYQGVAYMWVKTKKDGTPIGASGPRPRLTKPLTEFVLAYSTTPNKRTFPLLTEAQNQLIFAPKPVRGSHSRKPGDLHNLMSFLRLRLSPHAQYEIRVYAEAIKDLVQPLVPCAMAAFEDAL